MYICIMNLFKENFIKIKLPKNFMNVGVTITNHLTANTNDSANWDDLRFPLPPGDWSIYTYSNDNRIVTLRHAPRRRKWNSPWF